MLERPRRTLKTRFRPPYQIVTFFQPINAHGNRVHARRFYRFRQVRIDSTSTCGHRRPNTCFSQSPYYFEKPVVQISLAPNEHDLTSPLLTQLLLLLSAVIVCWP